MRIFDFMKARLNLTIDDNLLSSMKAYSNKKQISISELVEGYFKNLTKPSRRKNIIDLVEKLSAPDIDGSSDLKEMFYQNQEKKYGF
jgi:Family of unknown function (DUF6364)